MLFKQSSLLLLACFLIGCGGGDYSDLGTVSGTVTLDGQPLSNATVEFQPAEGRPSIGISDTSGNYTLEFSFNNPGASIGSHTVSITTAEARVKEKLPAKYHTKSELKEEVQGGSNTFDLHLTSS
ncbi:MAG: carboxypeptidase-like regulatory domain-containing protein [Pirellulales bacterium]|jgi:hypothetical protein